MRSSLNMTFIDRNHYCTNGNQPSKRKETTWFVAERNSKETKLIRSIIHIRIIVWSHGARSKTYTHYITQSNQTIQNMIVYLFDIPDVHSFSLIYCIFRQSSNTKTEQMHWEKLPYRYDIEKRTAWWVEKRVTMMCPFEHLRSCCSFLLLRLLQFVQLPHTLQWTFLCTFVHEPCCLNKTTYIIVSN